MKRKKRTTTITITASLGPRGVEKGVAQQSGSTHSGAEEKEAQNINVVGKTVGSEYSKYRCVVKIGFQKKSLRKERQLYKKKQQRR